MTADRKASGVRVISPGTKSGTGRHLAVATYLTSGIGLGDAVGELQRELPGEVVRHVVLKLWAQGAIFQGHQSALPPPWHTRFGFQTAFMSLTEKDDLQDLAGRATSARFTRPGTGMSETRKSRKVRFGTN